MKDVPRAIRRPIALARVGLITAVLSVGWSAAALAAPHAHAGRAKAKHHRKAPAPTITSIPWGSVGGQPVNLYTLRNSNRMMVKITNYGGVVQSIWVPRRGRGRTNVALGFPTLGDYVNDFTQGATSTPWPLPGGSGNTFFGAIIGRYANRIADAAFALNGTTYKLDANNGVNSLHGGYLGWNTKVWAATATRSRSAATLTLTALMPAGEGCLVSLSPGCTGYPAAVAATVSYRLTRDNQLQIHYNVINQSTTLATVINLTNHTYFNLGGESSGPVYGQNLALNSNQYTPTNNSLIPAPPYFVRVGGTPFDFRSMHSIGELIRSTNLPDGTAGPFRQLQIAHGYDHNWVLNGQGKFRLAAVAQDPGNGVTLWTYTDQPGVQVYTGNFLVGDLIGTSGHTYRQGDAFTLETQHYPDSPHHIGDPAWPSVVLNPSATFNSTTTFKFGLTGPRFKNSVHFR